MRVTASQGKDETPISRQNHQAVGNKALCLLWALAGKYQITQTQSLRKRFLCYCLSKNLPQDIQSYKFIMVIQTDKQLLCCTTKPNSSC